MSEQIANARAAALAVLKPSPRDLEHGLELHRQSLVFDAYGFSPNTGVRADSLLAALEAGLPAGELTDLSTKEAALGWLDHPKQREAVEEVWREAGVTALFQNAGEEGQDPLRMLRRLAHYTYVTDVSGFVTKAVSAADVEAARRAGRPCLCLTTNGVPLVQTWDSVRSELEFIGLFHQLGVRMMHLTYNRRNMLGDGCGEAADGGLSDLGRTVVAEMNRIGVIVDVAHSGWRTSLEAARASAKPLVASHSGSAAVHGHYRCKPDEVIRAIADTGGFVGVCCIAGFLGRTRDIAAFLDHVEDLARRFGPAHVAIGTDRGGSLPRPSAEAETLKAARFPKRTAFESFWRPEEPGKASETINPMQDPGSPTLAWTNWPLFTVGLVQRGLPDDAIRQIIGGNVLRVLRS